MGISSITHDFYITGKEEVEAFARALEACEAVPPMNITVKGHLVTDPKEFRELMKKWDKYHE